MSCITVYNKLQEVANYDSESWGDSAVVTLGRNPLTNLPFEHIASLSNHHLSIRKLGGHFYIRDEQSSNGTTADGVPLTHAVRMQVGVTYQAGPLTVFLEDAPLIPVGPDENADSVFPEPYAFALLVEPVYEAPAEQSIIAEPVYEAPAEIVAEAPTPAPVEAAPVGSVVDDDGCFDLEKLAALKKRESALVEEVRIAEPVFESPAPAPVEVAPAGSVVDDDGCFDLEKLAALKKRGSAPVEELPLPIAEPVVEAPAPAPVEVAPAVLSEDDDGCFDLEKLAALKKRGSGQASVQMAPQKKRLPQPFLPIGGIPKGGIPQDFRLELSTLDGNPQVQEGKALQLRVRSSVRCKLILICKDSNDTKTMLYPNRYQPGTDIPPNEWVTLPEEGTINYEFSLEGAGVDTIQAIGRKSEAISIRRRAQEGEKPEKSKAKWAYADIQIEVLPALKKK